MEELKACPFCGCKAEICRTALTSQSEPRFFVSCGVCGVETPRIAKTKDEAASAWNRRTAPENKPLTLEQLREMDGKPVYFDWDNVGWGRVIIVDGYPRIATIINQGYGCECALYTPADINGKSYAYARKPEQEEQDG